MLSLSKHGRATRGALAMALAASLLAACGGGGVSPNPGNGGGSGSGSQGAHSAPLAITLHMPGGNVQTARGRKPLYVSRDTKGMGVLVKADTGAGAYYTNGVSDTSPAAGMAVTPGTASAGQPGCTAAANNGSYSCTLYIAAAPVGYDDFRLTLWNAAPATCVAPAVSGCSFSGDTAIAVNVLNDYGVLSGQSNSIAITTLPIVDSVSITLSNGIADGASGTAIASTVLLDAQGDIIIGGDQLLDKSGANLSIALGVGNDLDDAGVTGSCSGGSNETTGNTCSLNFGASGPAAITTGVITTTTINYDGKAAFPTSGAVPTVTATAGGAGISGANIPATFVVSSSSGGPLSIGPVPQNGKHSSAIAVANLLASGSDGNLYVTSGGPPQTVLSQVIPSGTSPIAATQVRLAGPAGESLDGLASGSDNELWWTDNNDHTINREPVGTAVPGSGQPAANTGGFSGGASAPALAAQDNAQGSLANATTEFVVTTCTDASGESVASTEASQAITSPNNAVQVTSPLNSACAGATATGYNVYASTATGTEKLINASPIAIGTNYTILNNDSSFSSAASPAGDTLGAIVAGGDGNMYAIDVTGNQLLQIPPGTMTVAPVVDGLTSTAGNAIAVGTFSDGSKAVCYSGTTGAGDAVECHDLGGSNDTADTTDFSGVTANAMAFGPDGLLYVATSGGKVLAIKEAAAGGALSLVFSYTLPGGGVGIALGKDGAMWVTETTGALARIDPQSLGNPPATAGVLTSYPLNEVFNAASTTASLQNIVLGSDGELWIVDGGLGQLDQISP